MPAPKANQHNARHKGYDGRLNVEAVIAEKEEFKAHAKTRGEGKTLTDWVNESLRAQYKLEKDSDDE